MGVPKPLVVSTTTLLHGIPHHDTQGNGHDPTSKTGSSDEVGENELLDLFASGGTGNVDQLGDIDDMCTNMDGS